MQASNRDLFLELLVKQEEMITLMENKEPVRDPIVIQPQMDFLQIVFYLALGWGLGMGTAAIIGLLYIIPNLRIGM